MTTATTTLSSFLLARIAEDETVLREPRYVDLTEPIDLHQLLAECEAKRRIVERYTLIASGGGETVELAFHEQGLFEALHYLALPYADHPDYDEAWRP